MNYSTQTEIQEFKDGLGENPLFVCDMDGNITQAYSLPKTAEPNMHLFENGANPANQNIPFNYCAQELDYLVEADQLSKSIFAGATMDVRLPGNLVRLLNHYNETGQPFRLTLLTSRKIKEALQILRASGVHQPEKVTLVADSGATLQINGKYQNARPLSEEEQGIKKSLIEKVSSEEFAQKIKEIISEHVALNELPPELLETTPYIEVKNIAVNVHYRQIIEFLDNKGRAYDAAALDKKLGSFVHHALNDIVAGTSFSLRAGSLTVETILEDINKGHGLETIVQAAVDAGHIPSSVTFSGDDVCHSQNGGFKPGTDYYAMIAAPALQEKFGIEFYNVHTHHPEEKTSLQRGLFPKQDNDPTHLPNNYPKPDIKLKIAFPWENADLISDILNKSEPKVTSQTIPQGYIIA